MLHLQNQWKERDTSMWSFKSCVFEGILGKNEMNGISEVSLPNPPSGREHPDFGWPGLGEANSFLFLKWSL